MVLAMLMMPSVVVAEPDVTSDREALNRSREMQRLEREINNLRKQYKKQPRNKFINGTRAESLSPAYAEYMAVWSKRMERFGTLHYPQVARQLKQVANVVVNVGIRVDGSLHDVKIAKSSGIPELDKDVERIVRLAAPFAPFSEQMKLETDVLYIVRKWQFIPPVKKKSGGKQGKYGGNQNKNNR